MHPICFPKKLSSYDHGIFMQRTLFELTSKFNSNLVKLVKNDKRKIKIDRRLEI